MLAAAPAGSSAQTPPVEPRAPSSPQPAQAAGANAVEEFELNIDQRRISEKDFHAETDGAHGLQLGVGVALRASDIEVLLRNVRGHVRFRGNLAPVLRLLEAHRAAPAQTPPP
jgi:autotransporter translocation and assembly factor TamB